jgi:hypothetical protein
MNELARALVATDGSTDAGIQQCFAEVAQYSRSKNLRVFKSDQHMWVCGPDSQGPTDPRTKIVFQNSLEFRAAGHGSLWTETDQNPYRLTETASTWVGHGVLQGHMDLALKLQCLSELSPEQQAKTVLLLTAGISAEEGSATHLANRALRDDTAVVLFAPTDLRPATSLMGAAYLDIRIRWNTAERDHRERSNSEEATSTQTRFFNVDQTAQNAPAWKKNSILLMIEHLRSLPQQTAVISAESGSSFDTVPQEGLLELEPTATIGRNIGQQLIFIEDRLQSLGADQQALTMDLLERFGGTVNLGLLRTWDDGIQLGVFAPVDPNCSEEFFESHIQKIEKLLTTPEISVRCLRKIAPKQFVGSNALTAELTGTKVLDSSIADAALWQTCGFGPLQNRQGPVVVFGPGKSSNPFFGPNESISKEQLNGARTVYSRLMQREINMTPLKNSETH